MSEHAASPNDRSREHVVCAFTMLRAASGPLEVFGWLEDTDLVFRGIGAGSIAPDVERIRLADLRNVRLEAGTTVQTLVHETPDRVIRLRAPIPSMRWFVDEILGPRERRAVLPPSRTPPRRLTG